MARVERLAQETGDIGAVESNEEEAIEGSEKGRVFDMIIPVIALIICSVLAMLHNGGFWDAENADTYMDLFGAFGNCSASPALVVGGFGGLVTAFLLFIPRRVVKFRDFMSGITQGVKAMVPADIILVLAWTISGVCRDLLQTEMCIRDSPHFVTADNQYPFHDVSTPA